jgi:hypothetical protein
MATQTYPLIELPTDNNNNNDANSALYIGLGVGGGVLCLLAVVLLIAFMSGVHKKVCV